MDVVHCFYERARGPQVLWFARRSDMQRISAALAALSWAAKLLPMRPLGSNAILAPMLTRFPQSEKLRKTMIFLYVSYMRPICFLYFPIIFL